MRILHFLRISIGVICLSFVSLNILAVNIITVNVSGLNDASNGERNFLYLQSLYQKAKKTNSQVKYPANTTIYLTIPQNATSIQLSGKNDFNGATFIITNTNHDLFLFTFQPTSPPLTVNVTKKQIDSGDFASIPALAKGDIMLFIKDTTPWTERYGYNYKQYREDLLLLKNGKATNSTIFAYNTSSSQPVCSYLNCTTTPGTMENISFVRNANSTKQTYLLKASYQNNLTLENINISTPKQDKIVYGDNAIYLEHCAFTTINHLNVDGTYSTYNQFGYAIYMNNVYQTHICNMTAKAQWGVFGTTNVNTLILSNSDINRFDIHCLGKDILMKNSTFHNELNTQNTYNQFSSMQGYVRFDSCSFIQFRPVLIETSYNIYTKFDLTLNDCYWDLPTDHNCLVEVYEVGDVKKNRKELSSVEYPNITINNLRIQNRRQSKLYYIGVQHQDGWKRPRTYPSTLKVNNVVAGSSLQLIPFGY